MKSTEDTREGRKAENKASDGENKKKSRSMSGKRASIFGAILGNREAHDKKDEAKTEDRKGEDDKAKDKAVEPAEETKEAPAAAAPDATATAPTSRFF